MIFLQKDYDQITEILLEKRERSPLVQELANWMVRTVPATLLDIYLLPTPNAKHSADVSFIFEKRPEKLHLHTDEIILEFKRVAFRHKYANEEILREPFVEFVDFYNEARGHIARISANEARTSFIQKYPIVWEVQAEFSKLIVFFYTDTDITICESNKTCDEIINEYYSIIRKNDLLNYYSKESLHVSFDSKENVDKNFAGSLFYYSRR